jgi:hypothetical protein
MDANCCSLWSAILRAPSAEPAPRLNSQLGRVGRIRTLQTNEDRSRKLPVAPAPDGQLRRPL